jgi:UDP-N-acetylglucosamine 1-carboxyvinyltransferase
MQNFLEIKGGTPLRGTVRISGAKNAALPLMIASLLTAESCTIRNVPNLTDVNILLHLLENLGTQGRFQDGVATLATPELISCEASYSLVKALRASFWVLAPLLARGLKAQVAFPGGDAIGNRKVDIHLAALEKMGATIDMKHGVVTAEAPRGLIPAELDLSVPGIGASVGATHQVLMAAALAPGESLIRGAACEPEIVALAEMLTQMGAQIEGAGTPTIKILGQKSLRGCTITLAGDRIEAGTYIAAAAAVPKSSILLEGIDANYLGAALPLLKEMGLGIEVSAAGIQITHAQKLKAVTFSTAPFPGVATDLQALFMAALCTAEGVSTIEENIFENRFGHVPELVRMGAAIEVEDRKAIIRGVSHLSGAPVEAKDIRGGAALVIAALGAEGLTQIFEPQHLLRGYEDLDLKLKKIGANVAFRAEEIDDSIAIGC